MKVHNIQSFEDPTGRARSMHQQTTEEARHVKDLQDRHGAPLTRLFHHHNREELMHRHEEEARHAVLEQEAHPRILCEDERDEAHLVKDLQVQYGAPLTRLFHHREKVGPNTRKEEKEAEPGVWAYVSLY